MSVLGCWLLGTWKGITSWEATLLWSPSGISSRTRTTNRVKAVLDNNVIYFFPRLNPDGAEAMFGRVKWDRTTNGLSYDDDNDGFTDEDGPEDLNGDGYVTVMRVADPSGDFMIDTADRSSHEAGRCDEGRIGFVHPLLGGHRRGRRRVHQ